MSQLVSSAPKWTKKSVSNKNQLVITDFFKKEFKESSYLLSILFKTSPKQPEVATVFYYKCRHFIPAGADFSF